MKIFKTLLLLFGTIICPSPLIADEYPSSYIERQLADAQKVIEIDVSNIEPGELISVEYVDRFVWVYRRTAKDLAVLPKSDKSHLADPESENLTSSIEASYGSSSSYVWARLLLVDQPEIEKLPFRSKKDRFFVVGGWSPHSGCALSLATPEQRGTEEVVEY